MKNGINGPSFGQWLRQQRRDWLLTQEALGQAVGCAAETIRKIEAGTFRPSAALAERLATYFGVPAAEQPAFIRQARGIGAADAPVPPSSSGDYRIINNPMTGLPLVGRTEEIAAVTTLLRQPGVRLVTLTGPPGIGKTRLAAAVAAHYGPAALVPLAAVRDPAQIGSTIAATLRLPEQPGQDLTAQLVAILTHQPLLLVLDNCEQVLGAGPWISNLLGKAPRLQVLLTSRAPLRVYGEQEYAVPPLAGPDPQRLPPLSEMGGYPAVALFVQRAQAVQPGFTLTAANVGAVAGLCAQLDGLPLALELAAARLKFFTPGNLHDRLVNAPDPGAWLDLLKGGPQDWPIRHQTLAAALAWSDNLLEDGVRLLFRRLAVFDGGWTLEAARHIGDSTRTESAMVDELATLLDSNLVQRTMIDQTLRFHMPQTTRAYAWRELDTSGELAALRERHAIYYRTWAERVLNSAGGGRELAAAVEQRNLIAARHWTIQQGGLARAQPLEQLLQLAQGQSGPGEER